MNEMKRELLFSVHEQVGEVYRKREGCDQQVVEQCRLVEELREQLA